MTKADKIAQETNLDRIVSICGGRWMLLGGRRRRVTPPAQRGGKENGKEEEKSKKKRCGKWKAERSKSTADDSEMVAAKRGRS